MSLTKKQLIRWFKSNNPEEFSDCKAYGLKMRRIGSGAFREVYVINKPDVENRLVVKFPIPPYGLEHSQAEIRNINKVNRVKRYIPLRPFMPNMYYYNLKTGVILMDYYNYVPYVRAGLVANVLYRVRATMDVEHNSDIEYYNIREAMDGSYRLIDVGML